MWNNWALKMITTTIWEKPWEHLEGIDGWLTSVDPKKQVHRCKVQVDMAQQLSSLGCAGTPWHLLQHVQSFFILTPPVFCKSYHALMMSGCITVSLMKTLLSVQLQNRRLHCNLSTFGGSFNPSFSEWFSAILRKEAQHMWKKRHNFNV